MKKYPHANRQPGGLESIDTILVRVLARIPAPAGPAVRDLIAPSTDAAA